MFYFNLLRTEISSVLPEISQSLSELTFVLVSSIWREILKISFLSTGKTDFLRFWVIPNATVSVMWFLKDFGIFSERGRISELFHFIFLLACFPFLFAAASLQALESCFLCAVITALMKRPENNF